MSDNRHNLNQWWLVRPTSSMMSKPNKTAKETELEKLRAWKARATELLNDIPNCDDERLSFFIWLDDVTEFLEEA